jgi:AI-2E family transporter
MDQMPVLLDRLSTGDIAADLRGQYGWTEEQEFRLRFFLAKHKDDIQRLIPTIDRYLSITALAMGWLLLVPFLAIFFLRDGEHIVDFLIQLLFPPNRVRAFAPWLTKLHVMFTRFVRAQVLLCGLSFLFYSGALLLLQFPYTISLSVLGGLLEFIPVVGWTSTFRCDCRCGYRESLALDLDGGFARALESHSGLYRHATDYGTRDEDAPSGSDCRGIGRRRTRRSGWHLLGRAGRGALRVIWRIDAESGQNESTIANRRVATKAPSMLAETVTH